MVELIFKYFNLTKTQQQQFVLLDELYRDWNANINVISRKDIDSLYLKHVLHSLAIAKFINFANGTKILDIGTGGGFPGIPLAILFPECQFTLVDSIAKKIKVAEEVAIGANITNIDFAIGRVENVQEQFHFITARAVAPLNDLFGWTKNYLNHQQHFNSKINGYILLKGGDLKQEITDFKVQNKKWIVQQTNILDYFKEAFFDSKKLLYIYK